MITLPFDAVPGTSLLFNDYCRNTVEAKKYFIGHFSDTMAYEAHLQFLERRTYFRQELPDILARQNKAFGSPDRTFQHIDLLRESRTFAVVTGQQTGLFMGPLYTVYKALTAIHLAEWMGDQFPAHKFVPVFWLETEDHDLEEANEAGFITRQNEFVLLHNGEMDPETKNLYPVGGMQLTDTIGATIEKLRDLLQPTDFSETMVGAAEKAYTPDATYGLAFPRLFNALFKDSGLIFVDPSDKSLKQFLSPVIMREIETHPAAGEEVIARSAELEEHYHAQIKPRALNLFFHHNGKRYPIEPAESDFFLRGSRKRLTMEELTTAAEEAPEQFSPNVLLRPIFQDYLFPTAAYVAGPSEVAYFAQLGPVYDHFQIPMPIIFPRASITIVENKILSVLEKYNLPFNAMFSAEEDLLKEILVHGGDDDASMIEYQDIRRSVDDSLQKLKEFAIGFDPNLRNPAETTIANFHKSLGTFEEKMFQMKKQQDEVTRRQIQKLLVNLAPGGKPQERMLNILAFSNKYGEDILRKIEDYCIPFPAEHRLLIL